MYYKLMFSEKYSDDRILVLKDTKHYATTFYSAVCLGKYSDGRIRVKNKNIVYMLVIILGYHSHRLRHITIQMKFDRNQCVCNFTNTCGKAI